MGKRNFDYMKEYSSLRRLYVLCNEAEVWQLADPDKSALAGRKALEYVVSIIYALKHWDKPERASLFQLVDDEAFKRFVNSDDLMRRLHYIRKVGNQAAHQGGTRKSESFFSLLNLYEFVGCVLIQIGAIDSYPRFDKTLLTTEVGLYIAPKENEEEPSEDSFEIKEEQLPPVPQPKDITEAETRQLYIDLLLKEADWEIVEDKGLVVPGKACIEIEVQGMPTAKGTCDGKGFADYVLYDTDGTPLAVIEAKRTSVDPEKGRHQAQLYADCLEKKYGVKPVVYYTNGFTVKVIDRLGYPVRNIYGFHSKENLQTMRQRQTRTEIKDMRVDKDIAGRYYQETAVKAVCERLNHKHRRSLLVMATGTGKTRVSIAISDILLRNDWIKHILFLADRTTLVRQAHKSYVKHLPSSTTCILSEDKKPDMEARIMFSTYQTMINYIDSDEKEFSVGRFDLIFIDEAHRSVFGKYGTIFDYFDSLLVGLTATPREEIERSTYELLEEEEGEPTAAYDYEQAVSDEYLCPYEVINRSTKIMTEGLKYDQLTAEERDQLEDTWTYEKAVNEIDPATEYHRDIQNNEINRYIYNGDTIDKVLQALMDEGLKVEDGDKIGKTIIFAMDHRHAELIVEHFSKLYPELGPDYCQLVDYSVKFVSNIIDRFEERNNFPQIAVSVDMLDTGVDVPDVLNLVFFKQVRSKIKFDQMIGRGTRLSPDLFGPGKDKKKFLIFDWCGNFEFFNKHPKGYVAKPAKSLEELLFCYKVDMALALQEAEHQEVEFDKALHDALKQELHGKVAQLTQSVIAVRKELALVEKFKQKETWTCLSAVDAEELKGRIAPVLPKSTKEHAAKVFDFLLLQIELSLVSQQYNGNKAIVKVMEIAQKLQKKAAVPQVQEKLPLIKEISTPVFWENQTLDRLEHVRTELRDLLKLLLGVPGKTFEVDIEDVVEKGPEVKPVQTTQTYNAKVREFLEENKETNEALRKILHLEPLTEIDIHELEKLLWVELGSEEDYRKLVGTRIYGGNIAAFIRTVIGVDMNAAIKKLETLLNEESLNADQINVLRLLLDYVCENGDIDRTVLQDEQFEDIDWQEVFGDKVVRIGDFVNALHGAIEKGAFKPAEGSSGSRPYVLDENAITIANAAEEKKFS